MRAQVHAGASAHFPLRGNRSCQLFCCAAPWPAASHQANCCITCMGHMQCDTSTMLPSMAWVNKVLRWLDGDGWLWTLRLYARQAL